MVFNLSGFLVHWILQARILEMHCLALLQGIFLIQGSNLGLLHCRQSLHHGATRDNITEGSTGQYCSIAQPQVSWSK